MRVGLISDTHGLLRTDAERFLAGCDHIVHAGDICDAAVLSRLAKIAPVTAVRGNNDKGEWAQSLAETQRVQLGRIQLLVTHDLSLLVTRPAAEEVQVVVSGHSHRALIQQREGVLYVNPGSAGPRRFRFPITLGELTIRGDNVSARVHELRG